MRNMMPLRVQEAPSDWGIRGVGVLPPALGDKEG